MICVFSMQQIFNCHHNCFFLKTKECTNHTSTFCTAPPDQWESRHLFNWWISGSVRGFICPVALSLSLQSFIQIHLEVTKEILWARPEHSTRHEIDLGNKLFFKFWSKSLWNESHDTVFFAFFYLVDKQGGAVITKITALWCDQRSSRFPRANTLTHTHTVGTC